MKIVKTIVLWALTLLLVAVFLNAGIRKFFEDGGWTWMFNRLGFPVWFRITIGAIEVAAAALLLFPRTAVYGAATVIAVMIGAIGTLVIQGRPQNSIQAIVALAVAGVVLAMRWKFRYSFQRRIDSTT